MDSLSVPVLDDLPPQLRLHQVTSTDGDTEYQTIVDCNSSLGLIEEEINSIHQFIKDNYRLKFPELESIIHHPIDYARVVQEIGNETDLTLVDLDALIPSAALVMVISVTASTTIGSPLPGDVEACDRAITLDSERKKLIDLVENCMMCVAPNLSSVVGSAVAAKIIATDGGLSALANMPACNIQLLGAKESLTGFAAHFRVGYLEETEIFRRSPPELRKRATLIWKRIEKWQEVVAPRLAKALPVPVSEVKKKRGGRRLRKRR